MEMAKRRKVSVAGLNIRLHDHDDDRVYDRLIRRLAELRRAVDIGRDQRMALMTAGKTRVRRLGAYRGELARFTKLDATEDWFNEKKFGVADESDLDEIVIPDHLKPNLRSCRYIFIPSKHVLIFQQYASGVTFSPHQMIAYFEKIMAESEIKEEFGEADIGVIASAEILESIFSSNFIRSIRIRVQRPNPADFGDKEGTVLDRMKRNNAKQWTESWDGVSGGSLTPDEDVKEFAEVALKNGKIDAFVKDEAGALIKKSSESHPKIENHRYDPEEESEAGSFRRASLKYLTGLL